MGNTLETFRPFRESFRHLRDHGAGHPAATPDRPVAWDTMSFQRAIADAAKARGDGSQAPDPRTIRNWFSPDRDEIPNERFLEPIMDVLFPEDPTPRANFRAAWEIARAGKRRATPANDRLDLEPAPESTTFWIATSDNPGLGLAALYVHPQAKSNAEDNSFPLHLSLSLAQRPDEVESLPILLGLRAAHLHLQHENCQPRPMETQIDHIEERGGVFHVTGPRLDPSNHLEGKPLTNTKLLTMERTATNAPPAKVTVTLRSRHVDLEVIPEDPAADISPLKAKILQNFLQECQVSATDKQIIWGRAGTN